MTLDEAAVKFRKRYAEAVKAIARSRAAKSGEAGMPAAADMLPAVQAVVDSGAEPRHYAWYATSAFKVRSAADPELEITGVQNASSPRAFTPEAAAGFAHWFETASALNATAVRVAAEDLRECLGAGMSEEAWLEDCQEPVFKAERLLALLARRRLSTAQAAVVRAGEARLGYAPGYDSKAFPLLAARLARGGREDIGRPQWAT